MDEAIACKRWAKLFSQTTVLWGTGAFCLSSYACTEAKRIFACIVQLRALEMFKTSLDVHDTTIVPSERTKGVPLSYRCQSTMKERTV